MQDKGHPLRIQCKQEGVAGRHLRNPWLRSRGLVQSRRRGSSPTVTACLPPRFFADRGRTPAETVQHFQARGGLRNDCRHLKLVAPYHVTQYEVQQVTILGQPEEDVALVRGCDEKFASDLP